MGKKLRCTIWQSKEILPKVNQPENVKAKVLPNCCIYILMPQPKTVEKLKGAIWSYILMKRTGCCNGTNHDGKSHQDTDLFTHKRLKLLFPTLPSEGEEIR